jgi:predicted porin
MQKKLIALAIAGIAAVPAFAQSNVTIYGRLDYGYLTRSGDSGGVTGVNSKHEFANGVQAGSRIGFKGNEDLGNGLKAIFEYEFGTAVDSTSSTSSAATWVNRHSYVGLTGNFGTVVGGRLDGVRYGIFNKYDAFGGGTVGNFTQMTGQIDRADNAVAYISPNFSGFTVTAAYATSVAGQEAVGNVNDLRLNTLMGSYDNGPISVALDYETVKSVEPTAGNDTKIKVNTLAGSYDFGMVKLSGLWDSSKTDVAGARVQDYRDYFISAKVPFAGKFNAKFTWGKVDDKTVANQDSKKIGLGVDYAMSKRTGLYLDFGKITNKNGAMQRISPAANANSQFGGGINGGVVGSPAQNVGIGVKGWDLGIAHTF